MEFRKINYNIFGRNRRRGFDLDLVRVLGRIFRGSDIGIKVWKVGGGRYLGGGVEGGLDFRLRK